MRETSRCCWCIGANPVYDLPNAAGFAEVLTKVPYVVSFAPLVDETAAQADLILPDATYLESWGYDVLNPAFDLPVVPASSRWSPRCSIPARPQTSC